MIDYIAGFGVIVLVSLLVSGIRASRTKQCCSVCLGRLPIQRQHDSMCDSCGIGEY
jgi:hypothetical protein